MVVRRRLDVELVRRGLLSSREMAQRAIDERRVLVGGALAERSARQVDAAEPIELVGPRPRFVGRGGEKLDAALERFAIDVSGYTVLDAGASTGGFTDCVLQRGASSVVAVDVGHQQLHERLRADNRVEVHERTNVRTWSADALGGRRFDLVVADLSFISLTAVAVPLTCRAVGPLVVLIKPQFEAGRAEASRGRGVIRSRESWEASLGRVQAAFACSGAAMIGLMVSPITGAEGNVEFLAHFSMVDKLAILASPADVEMPRTERFDAMIQFALDEAARVGTGGHG